MGVNNRQRRAAKAKKRKFRARSARSEQAFYRERPGQDLLTLLQVAVFSDDERTIAAAVSALGAEDAAEVDRTAEGLLRRLVVRLWDNGWQPRELVRHGRRFEARAGRLIAVAVAVDHAMRDPVTLDPRWARQVEALELPFVEQATGWLSAFRRSEWIDRVSFLRVLVGAIAVLGRARPLHLLIPPPGHSAAARPPVGATMDDPVLVRVRALLAQAESTTFEAEAEAFTTKAQELMARHAIDAALLWAASDRDERPTTTRLGIDDPYADIKSLLLQHVAQRSRCNTVYDADYGLSTVVGFASDVAAAELLFTSLLVQSQAALRAEGAKSGPGSRMRSRAFRSSFLMAFTCRIDQRLAEINAAVEQAVDVERSGSLLPVLASRDDAVRSTVDDLFGPLRSSPVRGGSDGVGWMRGTMAADLAELNTALSEHQGGADTA